MTKLKYKLRINKNSVFGNKVYNTIVAMEQGMNELGKKMVATERKILNRIRYRGDLQKSVGHKTSTGLAVGKSAVRTVMRLEVGPNVPSGSEPEGKIWGVWKGARARWVPLHRLEGWLAVKGPRVTAKWLQKRIAGVVPGYQGGTSLYQPNKEFPFPEETLWMSAGDMYATSHELAKDISAIIK
jgi:hypothetical protein